MLTILNIVALLICALVIADTRRKSDLDLQLKYMSDHAESMEHALESCKITKDEQKHLIEQLQNEIECLVGEE